MRRVAGLLGGHVPTAIGGRAAIGPAADGGPHPVSSGLLRGFATAAFTTHVLPQLQDDPDVDVVVVGSGAAGLSAAITAAADPEVDAEWADVVDEDGAQDTPPADPETDGPEVDAPAPVDGPPEWPASVDGPAAWTPEVSL